MISSKTDRIQLVDVDYLVYDILIWNPSTRKVKALPSITFPNKLPNGTLVTTEFGFGISNDMTWKVVMLLEIGGLGEGERKFDQITMVYSQVHGDSWSLRQINSIPFVPPVQGGANDFYLKGSEPITKWGCSLQHERTLSELVKNGRNYPSPDPASCTLSWGVFGFTRESSPEKKVFLFPSRSYSGASTEEEIAMHLAQQISDRQYEVLAVDVAADLLTVEGKSYPSPIARSIELLDLCNPISAGKWKIANCH
nr:putative F-box protein At1g19160 [Ipomoea batatas]